MSPSPSFPIAKLVPLLRALADPEGTGRVTREQTDTLQQVEANLAARNGSAELTIVYEAGEDGWIVASIPEVPGSFSQGRTRAEARANVLDALRLMRSPEPGAIATRRPRSAR